MANEVDRVFERRVIRTLSTGSMQNLRLKDVQISDVERESVLRRIFDGSISMKDGVDVALAVLRPCDIKGVDVVFESMPDDAKDILGNMAGRGFGQGAEVTVDEMVQILEQCPTIIDFEEVSEQFKQWVRTEVAENEQDYYFEALRNYKKALYGRQYDYWHAFKRLRELAKAKYDKKPKVEPKVGVKEPVKEAEPKAAEAEKAEVVEEKVENSAAEKKMPDHAKKLNELMAAAAKPVGEKEAAAEKEEPKKAEAAETKKSDEAQAPAKKAHGLLDAPVLKAGPIETNGFGDIVKLSPDESMAILRATQIEPNEIATAFYKERSGNLLGAKKAKETGNEIYTGVCSGLFALGDDEVRLTIEMLEMADLAPTWIFECEGRKIALSKMFLLNGELVAIGYVNNGETWRAVTFFKGVARENWRLLPDYILTRDGKTMKFGVGVAQLVEQFVLPYPIQIALARVEASGARALLGEADVRLMAMGTAQRVPSPTTYQRTVRKSLLYSETDKAAAIELSKAGGVGGDNLRSRPEKLVIADESMPDFASVVASWQEKNETCGIITKRAIKSMDGRLIYIFSEDKRGRAWLSHVEAAGSPVNSFGVRVAFVKCGDVASPLYERPMRAGVAEDHDLKDKVKISTGAEYISMWPYVRRIPLIQKYLELRH